MPERRSNKSSSNKRGGGKRSRNKGQKKVAKVMREYKRGELRSSSGAKVKSREQAIAIGLSEARAAGAHIPKK